MNEGNDTDPRVYEEYEGTEFKILVHADAATYITICADSEDDAKKIFDAMSDDEIFDETDNWSLSCPNRIEE